jgi:hypothetical protein
MNDLVVNGNEQSRSKVKALAADYTAMAHELAAISVPAQYAQDHLALMQSFDSLGKATALVGDYEKDPASVFGAISVYKDASGQFAGAIEDLATALLAQGEPQQGQPGYLIVYMVRTAQAPK